MLARLVPDIKKTADLVAEISAACREQDIGGDQINQAIQQLDKVTQQNASASEQMSATSEELAAQSEQLQSSIAYFRIDSAPAQARRGPAVMDDPYHSDAPRRRISRSTSPPASPKFNSIAVSKPTASRKALPANSHDRQPAAKGSGLTSRTSADDHHDTDFVKY